MGFQLLCEPTSPGEFGRGLVGQAQQVLITYLNRMKVVPHLPCVLIIDEIDMLAPKREGKETSESKVDLLNTILTVFGGARAKEFPNLYLFGCTNRYHEMDEAFLRRMGAKIFVGKMSPNERREYIEESKCGFWTPEMLDLAVAVTSNFSGDNMKKFVDGTKISLVTNRGFNVIERLYVGPVKKEIIIDVALSVCKLERVMIGDYYLPSFFSTTFADTVECLSKEFLKSCRDEYDCTGRIFVDLSLHEPTLFIQTEKDTLVPITFDIKKSKGMSLMIECERQTIFYLVKLCINYLPPIHTIQVIKSTLMAQRSILDEESMQKFVFSLNEECHQYPTSLQMFCLDDLVHVRKHESNPGSAGMHHSISYSIARENLLEDILTIFNNSGKNPEDKVPKHWSVILCKDPYLVSTFKTKCQWPYTAYEKIQKEEAKKRNTPIKCAYCKKYYTEDENEITACMRHEQPFLQYTITNNLNNQHNHISVLYSKVLSDPSMDKQRCLWMCCWQPFSSTGCGQYYHSPILYYK